MLTYIELQRLKDEVHSLRFMQISKVTMVDVDQQIALVSRIPCSSVVVVATRETLGEHVAASLHLKSI
jgi:hypothetical protein